MTNESEGNELAKLLDRLTPEQLARVDALAPPGSPAPSDRATRLCVLRRLVLLGLRAMERDRAKASPN